MIPTPANLRAFLRSAVAMAFLAAIATLFLWPSPASGQDRTPGVPDKPMAVWADVGPNQELEVEWEPPSSDGGSPIISYKVQWRHDEEGYDVTPESTRQHVVTDLSDLRYTVSDLTKEGIHWVRVIATNSVGDSPPSLRTKISRNTAPPELVCVEVSRSKLSLVYNKYLDRRETSPASNFVVTVGGITEEITNVNVSNSSIDFFSGGETRCPHHPEVGLTLAEPVKSSDVVEVSYTTPDNPWALRVQDEAGQPAASFSAERAKNTTTNSRPRGLPTITGTALVGYTLTASIVNIYDYDGLTSASYGYQWISNDGTSDTDIEGATGSVYTLAAADEGKVVKVRASYTDDGGFKEMLTSAATDSVATAAATGSPRSVVAAPGGIQELDVSWEVPSDDGGSPVTGYKVQWKSGGQEYDSSREAAVTGLSYTITGLTGDLQHTVRVIAVHDGQDGSPSPGVSGTPLSGEKTLLRFIENDILATYGDDNQWLAAVLEMLRKPGTLVVNREIAPRGRVSTSCSPLHPDSGPLRKCRVYRMEVHPDYVTDRYTIIHEMAHIYTLGSGLVDNPGPIAMAHLYFVELQSQWTKNDCPAAEIYADALAMLALGDDADGTDVYWNKCNSGDSARTEEGLSVVGSAVAGQTPQWFSDTYDDSEGNPDLEQVWSDVKNVPFSRIPTNGEVYLATEDPKAVIVYQLRDEFGGYCDEAKAWESASVLKDGATRNPWRDGGCVPEAPGTLTAFAGDGQITLEWETPAYDGGSPIESYLVQWKSGSQEYDNFRQKSVTDPAVLTHTVSGLTNGVEYTVSVRAYNHNGAGAVSEAAATPRDTTVPRLLATIVSGLTLTLTYSEALDEDSIPQSSAFAVTVGDSSRGIAGVSISGTTVSLTLTSPVVSSDGVSVDYTLPADSMASRIQDTAGNDAPSFNGQAAENRTPSEGNRAPTGQPSIIGTAQVGETLTAETHAIVDLDGLTGATFSHQWISNDGSTDTYIQGATGSTYELVAPDEGKKIKVQVTFTDDGSSRETLTSLATGEVAPTMPLGICDRTRWVREALLQKIHGVDHCSQVTVENLKGVTGTLDLTSWRIFALKSIDFQYLSSLEKLDMNFNLELESLPEGLFDDLTALKELDMFSISNGELEIPDGIFDNLSSLESLELSYNGITELTDGVFDGLSNLKRIRLGGNPLEELPEGVFDNLVNLESLLMDSATAGIGLTELPEGVFDNLSNLRHLDLFANELSDLPADVFDNLSNLESLSLASNNLSELPEGAFEGISNLNRLMLSRNPGAPFTYTAELKQQGNEVEVEISEAVPFNITVTVSAKKGTLSVGTVTAESLTVTVEAGTNTSEAITVIPDSGQTQVTVNVDSAEFPHPENDGVTFYGIQTAVGTALTVAITSSQQQQSELNSSPMGLPVITGAAQVGETLTASTSNIADADGLTNPTFSYQWVRNDGTTSTDIEDVTDSTYRPSVSDVGKTITVRVTFRDDAENQETLTSAATAAVTAQQTISGSTQETDTNRQSYITVVVVDDDSDPSNAISRLSVSWFDQGTCPSDYNAYLDYKLDDGTKVRTHLGSAATDDSRISGTLSSLSGGEYAAEVYCGFFNAETNQHPVASVEIRDESTSSPGYATVNTVEGGPNTIGKPRPGTYSTAPPMTSLVVNPGSLDPAFHRGQLRYTIADVPSSTGHLTLLPMAVNGSHFAFVKNAVGNPVRGSCSQVVEYYWECEYSYGEGAVVISDADFSLPGFQVDLDEGENQFALHIYGGSGWDTRETWSQMYRFTITRIDDGPVEESPNNPATSTLPVDSQSNPLTSLNVSPGTLTPTFARAERNYTVSGVPSDIDQVTLHAMGVNGSHFVFLKNPHDGFVIRACSGQPTGLAQDSSCSYGYQEGSSVLADADPSTPGFQVDLEEEETRIGIHVHGLDVWESVGVVYILSITRAGSETQNSPATGVPTIIGTAQLGETLTAGTSGIADVDGLTSVAYQYQWLSSRDFEIDGATSSTYTLKPSDVGKIIKVQVSFTDDSDNEEMLTSAPTTAVAPKPNSLATGLPTISGIAKVGEKLTVDVSTIEDADGLSNASFGYQWVRIGSRDDTDINDATGSTYTLVADDEGKTVKVRVSFTDDGDNQEARTSEATLPVTATFPGAPEHLNVFPHDAESLDLAWHAPESDGGSDIINYKVQWKESDDTWDTPSEVSLATVSETTHTISGLTDGQEYSVRVYASNEVGDSPPSAEVTGAPRETTPPKMVRPRVDSTTLRVLYDEALDENSVPSANVFDVRVVRRGSGELWQAEKAQRGVVSVYVSDDSVMLTLASAVTADDYVVISYTAPSDVESPRIRDIAGNAAAGFESTEVFNDTEEVEESPEQPNNGASGTPTISGIIRVGETLTADTSGISDADGLTKVSYGYQWIRSDGNAETDITGATNSTYEIAGADEGKTIRVRVTFTDDANNEESLTSAATSAVAEKPNSPAAGSPSISGMAQVGETLTASTSGISDADGLTKVSYGYQWIRSDGNTETDISGATNSTYELAGVDEGKTIKVRVTFTDDANNEESLISQPTATVAAVPPLTADFLNTPSTHDGQASITFELRFSEDLSLSYRVLKEQGAFLVTGGTIIKTKRIEQGNNTRWDIHVQPDGNGNVSIVLPITTDCNAQGAICTSDGRKLSNRNELSVSGP